MGGNALAFVLSLGAEIRPLGEWRVRHLLADLDVRGAEDEDYAWVQHFIRDLALTAVAGLVHAKGSMSSS